MSSLTVVIPTFNREAVLRKALEAYLTQSNPDAIRELLVVDDGSTDGTGQMVAEISRQSCFPIRYLRQCNRGPAAARNFGIREARSPIVLFTDSDIIPNRDLVAQHLEWHGANPETRVAVLGYVTWPAQPKPTPFMKWYGEEAMFRYRELQHEREISFTFFYTCNLSLKTEFLRTRGQFDEDFKSAAYEDTELAYRLNKTGLRLLYNARAVAYHYQFFSFSDACNRAKASQAAEKTFLTKEAGRILWAPRQKRRSRLWFPLATWVATMVGTVLRPARGLLNSSVPLPRLMYRLFYWYDVTRTHDILRH
jgi:glycosyltransferase involved in cell wall biosynthesis